MKKADLFILVNATEEGEIGYRGIYTNLSEAIGEAMQDAADLAEEYGEAGDEFTVSVPQWLESGAGWLVTACFRKAGAVKRRREYWHVLTGDLQEAHVKLYIGIRGAEIRRDAARRKGAEEDDLK